MRVDLRQHLAELGVAADAQLFDTALTHRSFAYEHQVASNERLEFLGDAVLQIVVTEHIFQSFPDLAEGQLAKLRASVVNTRVLAEIARCLDVGSQLRLGKGEVATGGHDKSSILADTMEALIGAVHVTVGADASRAFVLGLVADRIETLQRAGDYTDVKTTLQEFCAAQGWSAPTYVVTGTGPDHDRRFSAAVMVDGEERGHGEATTKKHAEQLAAAEAMQTLAGRHA